MEIMGIDVSKWQGIIDFARIDKSKVHFCIIKIGGNNVGEYEDSRFKINYQGCEKIGLNTGCYYYLGEDFEVAATVRHLLTLLDGRKFSYPVYLDIEETSPNNKTSVTKKVKKIGEALEACGYYVGIYGSDISTFKERVDIEKLKRFTLWVACYGTKPQYVKTYGMRQYANNGKVSGISGKADLNYAYQDFPTIIKGGHFNGY